MDIKESTTILQTMLDLQWILSYKKQDKAMWVDVDTIVKCDVVSMVRSVLTDKKSPNTIAAVPSERSPRGFYKEAIKDYNIKVGFNAGVYVVDLAKWRRFKMTEKIRNIALTESRDTTV